MLVTLRRDCLDHVLPVDERHLRAVLAEYVDDDNRSRPHRSLRLRAPLARARPALPASAVIRRDRLGGLVHEYEAAA